MDSESRNKAAQDLLEEKNNENTVDPFPNAFLILFM